MSLKEILTGLAIGLLLFFVIGLAWLWRTLGDVMCGETLLGITPSPDATKVVYFFESGCGATTPNVYHYFLEPTGRMDLKEMNEFKKRDEFFQRIRGGATMKWMSDNQIELVYVPYSEKDSRITKQKSRIGDVQIKFIEKPENTQAK